ncbi:nucleoside hydrolase [Pedobacter aquatilis]|uniref:nucleoside hydrolase n=1 Tax=Pedobacter aquatilis TaxID=351343 RepID=UPI0029309F6C|nr:nucleoside hydrolase [Pedobacter aquatilis]
MKTLKSILFSLGLFTTVVASAQTGPFFESGNVKPRMRVIVDNDFGGDPDGLFQLTHQALSPSADIRGIIGSHLKPGDPFDKSDVTATNAKNKAIQLLKTMKLDEKYPVTEGSNKGLTDVKTPQVSEAAKLIIKEAMRDDTKLPLYVVCGAGLTDLASAYLMEPKIASRLTLVWIGGPEYTDIATPPPGYTPLEYNLGIDKIAAQVIFNISNISIWQVPRNAYRQTLLSYAELFSKIKPKGEVGKFLSGQIESLMKRTQSLNFHIGETYIMGDSPLVLLTALQSSFEADPSSSDYLIKQAPKINDAGLYEVNTSGRNIRVYNRLDTRLMFEDFFAKLDLFNAK